MKQGGILHWNGANKAWKPDGYHVDIWKPVWRDFMKTQQNLGCKICPTMSRQLSTESCADKVTAASGIGGRPIDR